jgi:transposase
VRAIGDGSARAIDGLAVMVQEVLQQDPFFGHLFGFRRRKANLIKIVFWDGTGLCIFTKRLEHGVFLWPPDIEPVRTLALSSVQLAALLEGIDWRSPERQWRSAVAG